MVEEGGKRFKLAVIAGVGAALLGLTVYALSQQKRAKKSKSWSQKPKKQDTQKAQHEDELLEAPLIGISDFDQAKADQVGPLDPARFSDERFSALILQIKLRVSCTYVRNSNLLLKIIEGMDNIGQTDGATFMYILQHVRKELKLDIISEFELIAQDYCFNCAPSICTSSCESKDGLSVDQLKAWIYSQKDSQIVQSNYVQLVKDMHFQLFNDGFKVTRVAFHDADLPLPFSKENYVEVYRKIWDKIRFEMKKVCQALKNELKVDQLPQDQFQKAHYKALAAFDLYRKQAFSKLVERDVSAEDAIKSMQMRFVISAAQDMEFANEVLTVKGEHGQVIDAMAQNNFEGVPSEDPFAEI